MSEHLADAFRQHSSGVRLEWGAAGAAALAPGCAALVIVDVLSFTTSVCVAAERGTRVFPYPGAELRARGFAEDVEIAAAARASSVVPVLQDGAFTAAS